MPRHKPPTKEESLLLPAYAALPDSAIHIPATDEAFDASRKVLLQQSVLGFDTESKPIFHTLQVDNGPHVVQFATSTEAWILQLHHPQAVALTREIVASPHICKVGFGLDNDKSSLPRSLNTELHNVLDLDRLFKRHGYGPSTGVRAAVALVLGQNFQKSKKQSTSNWAARNLTAAQIRYAANDAHAPALVYAAFPAWEATQPQTSSATTARRSAKNEARNETVTAMRRHAAAPENTSTSSAKTTESTQRRLPALFAPSMHKPK